METQPVQFAQFSGDELKDFADKCLNGLVFHHGMVKNAQLHQVFMPLALMAISDEDGSNIGLIYEYLENASTVYINGNPIFSQCRFLTKSDTEKLKGLLWRAAYANDLYNKLFNNG